MSEFENEISFYKSRTWTFLTWQPTPALVNKQGMATHQYTGQHFDPQYFKIDPKGWNHDHCELCQTKFCENNTECETQGFNSGNLWLCITCYSTYIQNS